MEALQHLIEHGTKKLNKTDNQPAGVPVAGLQLECRVS
ncbi:hypothetical protein SORBI_3007G141460 [Sorghum bicolor]|uniref:Uncharacterized protein n=1 Tax=Sorghum bicolor TaxID=4558 RepID=A0A1Z5R9W0_SORBI|nr:hypothetical protein SORBI_3007G141460 [Sorghum bicolor]